MPRRPLPGRRVVALASAVLAAVALGACGAEGGSSGGLPAGDHVHALRVLSSGELLLGLHGALYRSRDEGRSWQRAGMEGMDAMSIAAASAEGPLFVAGHNLLARSYDGGQTFQRLRPAGLASLDVHAFAQSASDPGRVYAFVVGGGVYASADAGETWELRAASGQGFGQDLSAMAVSPSDADLVLAGGDATGLVRSTDGGRTFARVLPHGVASLATGGDDPDRVVALTARGLEASTDGGRRWAPVRPRVSGAAGTDPALPGPVGRPAVAGQPVAVAAGDGDQLWLVTEAPRTLQRSDDGGATWSVVSRTGG